MAGVGDAGPGQAGDEVPDLGQGELYEAILSGSAAPLCFDGGEGGVGEHGQGDVPVPAGVLADLVVVQAGFALGGLECFLDRPADTGHLGQGDALGGVADEVIPAGQQPVLGAAVFGAVDPDPGPQA